MRDDDPGVGNLGLNIHMDGETLNVAQKSRSAYIDENNYVVFGDAPEIFGPAPPGETQQEKIQRGKQILREARNDDPGVGNLGLNIHMDGQTLSIAQKEKDAKKNDDPDGDLGMSIKMDGETYNIAQKKRSSHLNDRNLVGMADAPELFGPAPPYESQREKIQRGKQILREARNDDPGVGNLGLNIHMDGETYNIAQKKRSSHIDDRNLIGMADAPELFGPAPPGETPEEKIQRGKHILREQRKDDPGIGNLGLNIRMGGETYNIAQK